MKLLLLLAVTFGGTPVSYWRLVTHVERVEHDLEIVLPEMREVDEADLVVIELRAGGGVALQAELLPAGEEGMRKLEVFAAMNRELAFEIAAHPEAKHERFVDVINALARAKVTDVRMTELGAD